MNSSLKTQRSNVIFFLGTVVVSVVLMAASGVFLTGVLSDSMGPVASSAQSCKDSMRLNGFNPTEMTQGEIKVERANISDIERLVFQSGVIIENCPSYALTDYCAGAACLVPGVSFTLKEMEL